MKAGWKRVKLGDCLDFLSGKAKPKICGSYPIYGSNGIIGMSPEYMYENAFIIGRVGAVGELVWCAEKFWASDNTIVARPKADIIDIAFAFYTLRVSNLKGDVHGSAQPLITKSGLRDIDCWLPPLPVQRRIAAVLGALDDKIELNRKMNANLEAQAQALFKSWFVDFTPWGGKMPKEWKSYSFSDILSRRSEKVSADACVMYAVTNTGIKSREKIFNKNLAFNGTKGKLIKKGDLVFGMSRAILNWGVMRDALGGVSSAYHVYKVSDIIPSEYLEGYIAGNIRRFTSLIKPAAREGQGFDSDGLMQMSIELPTNSDYTRFKKQYDPLCNMLVVVNEESRKLAETRDALLPKLMSGEVEVT